MSSQPRVWIAIAIAAVFLPVAAMAISDPRATRAQLVSHSEFRLADDRYFLSPSFPESQFSELVRDFEEAEGRVAELFGAYASSPWVIVAADPDSSSRYSYNQHATIHAFPLGEPILVLGPEGIRSVDVIAHELAHAEHLRRVGFATWMRTPAWFREGLAMQVDHRPKYSEEALEAAGARGIPLPEIRDVTSFRRFNSGPVALHYAAARAEVSGIRRGLGASGLSAWLAGQSFWDPFEIPASPRASHPAPGGGSDDAL